jgi:hypothetical protein
VLNISKNKGGIFMQKLSSLRVTICLAILFSIVSLIACTGSKVQMEKSSYDGTANLIMNDITITTDPFNVSYNRPKTTLRLNWNDSMPKGYSLAKVTMSGQYKNSNDTAININVAGEKIKFKTIDINKISDVTTKSMMLSSKYYTETENTLEIYFYIPDNVVIKVAKSQGDSYLMINLANNVKVESSIRSFYNKDFAEFINSKQSLKSK